MNVRSLSILLLLSLSISLIAACGEDAEPNAASTTGTDVTEPETETEPEGDRLPDTDMQGWELSILNFDESWLTWANTRILVDEQTGDVLNDAIHERNAGLQERFNCQLKVDEVRNVGDHISKFVLAGDDSYDIYAMQEGQTNNYLPYTMDWHKIPYMNLDKVWWNPAATSVYEFDGKQTALAGNMTLSAASRAVSIVFNKRLWEELGDPEQSLYELVYDNKWTVDKFIELSRTVNKDVDGDTKWTEDDIYGMFMGRGFKGYIASFLCGSDMNFTSKNESGEDVFTLNTNERGLDLLTKLVDAWLTDGYTYYTGDVHTPSPANFFENGHALFSQRVPNDIYKLRDMDDDIGILPMPKSDEAQENYCSAAWGGVVWTLAKTFDMQYADNLGIVLEAMSYAGYHDIIPVYKEIALKTKTARDDESAAMLDIVFDTIYFDFGTNIMYDAVFASGFLNSIFMSKSSDSIVSSIEKNLPQIEKYISDIFVLVAEME